MENKRKVLIDQEDAIDIVRDVAKNFPTLAIRIIHELKQMPTQSETMLCKDCELYDGKPCGIVNFYNIAGDFCSKGLRKHNE